MIDWDKPLLIKSKGGEEWSVSRRKTGTTNRGVDGKILRIIQITSNGFDSEWVVNESGEDINDIMPKVYNAKRKSKKGELWWCKWELQVGNEEFKWFKEPVRFDGEKFPLVPDHATYFEILEPYLKY